MLTKLHPCTELWQAAHGALRHFLGLQGRTGLVPSLPFLPFYRCVPEALRSRESCLAVFILSLCLLLGFCFLGSQTNPLEGDEKGKEIPETGELRLCLPNTHAGASQTSMVLNPPEVCLDPRSLGPAPVSDSVDLTWSLRTCISGKFMGDAAAVVGTTLGSATIVLEDLSHRQMI